MKPFSRAYPLNPSSLVLPLLPKRICLDLNIRNIHDDRAPAEAPAVFRTSASAGRTTGKEPSSSQAIAIHIVVHPEPVKVSYDTVDRLIPVLYGTGNDKGEAEAQAERGGLVEHHEGTSDYDFVIHIGMAGPSSGYQLEMCARRSGYCREDVDGRLPRHHAHSFRTLMRSGGQQPNTQKDNRRDLGPEMLSPEHVNWAGLLEHWCANVSRSLDAHVVQSLSLSTDAGLYLCEYIYYSSLLYFFLRRKEKLAGEDEGEGEEQEAVRAHMTATSTMSSEDRSSRSLDSTRARTSHLSGDGKPPSMATPQQRKEGQQTRKDTQVVFLHVPALVVPRKSSHDMMRRNNQVGLGKNGETYGTVVSTDIDDDACAIDPTNERQLQETREVVVALVKALVSSELSAGV